MKVSPYFKEKDTIGMLKKFCCFDKSNGWDSSTRYHPNHLREGIQIWYRT
jgi:hypothetical protein